MADDGNSWSAWFDEHAAALVLLARQWVPSRADAEDVVRDAFVRCWRSDRRQHEHSQHEQNGHRQRIGDPAAYLYACVKRCALDWQRSRSLQLRREQATARPEAESLFAGSLEQDERRSAVEAALRALPESQSEVLVMRIWGGLTFPQIAAALEISENTAASRYRYALARLREQLAEEPIL